MKSLKYVKKLKEETTILSKMIELYCDKINKEHQKNIYAILENIANGEGLDIYMLQSKYLKKQTPASEIEITNTEEEQVLDKIIFNNKTYYIDKNNDNVYDTSSVVVGKYNNNNIIFNS